MSALVSGRVTVVPATVRGYSIRVASLEPPKRTDELNSGKMKGVSGHGCLCMSPLVVCLEFKYCTHGPMNELDDGCTMWRCAAKICQKRCSQMTAATGQRGDGGSKHCPSPSFLQPVSLISAVGWMASLGGMGSGTVTCGAWKKVGTCCLLPSTTS